jgi:hypothetical protein
MCAHVIKYMYTYVRTSTGTAHITTTVGFSKKTKQRSRMYSMPRFAPILHLTHGMSASTNSELSEWHVQAGFLNV